MHTPDQTYTNQLYSVDRTHLRWYDLTCTMHTQPPCKTRRRYRACSTGYFWRDDRRRRSERSVWFRGFSSHPLIGQNSCYIVEKYSPIFYPIQSLLNTLRTLLNYIRGHVSMVAWSNGGTPVPYTVYVVHKINACGY